jgi:hypothetical protein
LKGKQEQPPARKKKFWSWHEATSRPALLKVFCVWKPDRALNKALKQAASDSANSGCTTPFDFQNAPNFR